MRFLLTFILITFSFPAIAEEKKLDDVLNENIESTEKEETTDVTFSPDHCDFEITFPEDPFQAKRCPQRPDGGSAKCYEITNYTMVYNMKTTVDVSVTCVPSPPRNFDRYNERVIQTVLNGMTRKEEIEDPSINVTDEGGYRLGTLIGTGTYGKQGRIYNAQIWVGQNSVMTIEAKLVGPAHHEADTVYTDILKSIKKKEPSPAQP
jgi:hypothetical protein